MKFYKIEVTQFLSLDQGVAGLTFYILPESLDFVEKLFGKYKKTYTLTDPVLVEVEDKDIGKSYPEGAKNACVWVGPEEKND